MMSTFTRRAAALTTAMLVAVSFSGITAASADTYSYKDIKRPNGQERKGAVERVDARACGMSGTHDILVRIDRFNACMAARGWALDHIDRSPEPASETNELPHSPNPIDSYDNILKTKRGNAELQVDTQYCDQQAGAWRITDEPTPDYRKCMLSRGWRYSHSTSPSRWIDPETGDVCRDVSGAAVCGNF
jgi:hypothetical protein